MNAPKKLGLKKLTSDTGHDFVDPQYYFKTLFGVKAKQDQTVTAYVLEVSALELTKIFRIFEDLPNVHEWPISKLIQRELDKQRAALMSRDYLLGGGFLKYFPPLTAVLIPTDAQHLPSDAYPAIRPGEAKAADKFWKGKLEDYATVLTQRVTAGGIYDLAAEGQSSGYVFWDKTAVTAVVIDGQHRYKALMEAMNSNKDFNQCRVVVNLIDIPQIAKRANRGPTSVARDLFVTINNTPVEVDEARLVLMDDRDAIATFTQVLVDDSETGANSPAVPAELVDWRCDQGKHDGDLALTGILTLRGVIATALFQNRTIDSVDSRSSRKRVKDWLYYMSLWVDPDPTLRAKLGASETLQRRFEAAQAENETPQEEEDSEPPFLFSYTAAASALIKLEFKKKYLALFREMYGELTPYKRVREVAKAAGAFDKGKELHRYLRAFTGQRRELQKEGETAQAVASYRKEVQKVSADSIPHTVMGQKAIFKSLFDGYLSDVKATTPTLLKETKSFIKDFNETYDLLNPSANFDECFSSTKFRLKKSQEVEAAVAGDLAREFWRGIILGDRGQIDYGEKAVGILSQVYLDALQYTKGTFQFTDRDKLVERHIRVLRKFDSDITEAKAEKACKRIVEAKERTVERLLKG